MDDALLPLSIAASWCQEGFIEQHLHLLVQFAFTCVTRSGLDDVTE